MPVHPFVGMRLPLVRLEKDETGRRYLLLEHSTAGVIRLPVEWTDRAAPWVSPRAQGRDVRLDLRGLLKLAAACAVALGRKLDGTAGTPTVGPEAEQMVSPANDSSFSGALGDVVGGATAAGAGRLGDPGPQGDSSRRRRGAR